RDQRRPLQPPNVRRPPLLRHRIQTPACPPTAFPAFFSAPPSARCKSRGRLGPQVTSRYAKPRFCDWPRPSPGRSSLRLRENRSCLLFRGLPSHGEIDVQHALVVILHVAR